MQRLSEQKIKLKYHKHDKIDKDENTNLNNNL